ncbi:MAG: peptidylprolyl isomerase [Cyanobacteria bacterium J06626_18]
MQLLNRWLMSIALGLLLWTGLIASETLSGAAYTRVNAAPLASAWVAYLPPGDAITDGRALLRYSLPIDNKDIRTVQSELEGLSKWLRSQRWGPVKRDVTKINKFIGRRQNAILAGVPEEHQVEAADELATIRAGLELMLAAADNRDREAIWQKRRELLTIVNTIEETMVTGFPFEVPAEYSNLPQLKGRATVEFETTKGKLIAVVDGFSAPVTAGNFVDLVKRGFYDGLPFIRAEDNYVLQTGDPEGPDDGFIDPKTGEYRAVPLEVLIKGDEAPVYGVTMEELGRYLEDPVLPFSAFGTMGMARPESEPNGGSSQFFFFLFEAEMTPAGLNLLDGRYSVFGYVIEGEKVLDSLGRGDRVISAEVIDGLENLVEPA